MACPFYMAAWLEKVNCSAAESFMIMLFENYLMKRLKYPWRKLKRFVFSCFPAYDHSICCGLCFLHIFLWNARKCLTNGILMNIIKNAITIGKYAYHVNIMVFSKEVEQHEDDISAEEKIQSESSRIPSENEHFERQKSSLCQKSKGKT